MTDLDLFDVEQHTVDGLVGSLRGFRSLVMDETVARRRAVLVSSNLAAQHIPEGSKGVVESLR